MGINGGLHNGEEMGREKEENGRAFVARRESNGRWLVGVSGAWGERASKAEARLERVPGHGGRRPGEEEGAPAGGPHTS